MATLSDNKLLALILENPELLAAIKDSESAEELVATVSVGRQREILVKKCETTTPESIRERMRLRLTFLARQVSEEVKKSGTSGDQRFTLPTAYGNMTVCLSQPKAGE